MIDLTIQEFFDDNFPPDIITDEYFIMMGFNPLPMLKWTREDRNALMREICIDKYRFNKINSLPVLSTEERKERNKKRRQLI